jgi:hypothetical protein
MTTHVFIVDSKTFKIHLEYLFAGTGASTTGIDFNNIESTQLHHTTENMLISMIADASRIRKDDKIIFYLQQNFRQGIREGKFYGVFKAKDDWSFLDNYEPKKQYLLADLGKSLTFRALIEPLTVYPKGVTEWEALDEIRNLTSPNQMLWSLIYRKLKGNRGNTMITIYESERLCQLIRNKNNRECLNPDGNLSLSFDNHNQEIILLDQPVNQYNGSATEIDVSPRLICKYNQSQSFEAHLQAYIIKNIGMGINASLDENLLEDYSQIEWIGNEVSCGVGMQRMDIMISLLSGEQRRVIPVELKAVEIQESNVLQIKRYIEWIEQYYIPNRFSDIQPVLIGKSPLNRKSQRHKNALDAIKDFNKAYSQRCCNLKYIEYYCKNNNLTFEQPL